MEYVPSGSAEKSQVSVVAVATNVQVIGDPVAGVAVRVMVAPTTSEETLIVGVLSEVILSLVDDPESELAERFGAAGTLSTPTLMVRVIAGRVGVSPCRQIHKLH